MFSWLHSVTTFVLNIDQCCLHLLKWPMYFQRLKKSTFLMLSHALICHLFFKVQFLPCKTFPYDGEQST